MGNNVHAYYMWLVDARNLSACGRANNDVEQLSRNVLATPVGNLHFHAKFIVLLSANDDFFQYLITFSQEMFDLLISLGANINIRNRQGLIPLVLSAALGCTEVECHSQSCFISFN